MLTGTIIKAKEFDYRGVQVRAQIVVRGTGAGPLLRVDIWCACHVTHLGRLSTCVHGYQKNDIALEIMRFADSVIANSSSIKDIIATKMEL